MQDKYNIIPGSRFGQLQVLCESPKFSGNSNRRVSVLCDCGTAKTCQLTEVVTGKLTHCGCLTDRHHCNISHGHTSRRKMSPEYYSWASMSTRCSNPKHSSYARYGGRGIQVCERWRTFALFLEDMGPRGEGESLDRIDNDKGYTRENCRWASREVQANNRSSNSIHEYRGERHTLAELARKYGVAYNTLHSRLRLGWTLEAALEAKPRPSRYTIMPRD
jgi:hypothetical protein